MRVRETAVEVLVGIITIVVLVSLMQVTVAAVPWSLYLDFLGSTVLVTCGLILFLLGVNFGLVNTGEVIGSAIASRGKLGIILLFGFIVGLAVTVPEPDVQALALQMQSVSEGTIDGQILIATTALGVGLFTALALLRIFLSVPTYHILAGGYALALILMIVSPPVYANIAFDAGGGHHWLIDSPLHSFSGSRRSRGHG